MTDRPELRFERDVPLAPLTTLELGGPARLLANARTERELQAILRWARSEGEPVLLLGGGSNLVVSDAGFDGLAIRVGLEGRRVEPKGEVWAAAGEPWDALVRVTTEAGLAGFECLSGIPGSVGATPIQNVGAYGREVAELVTEVRVLDRQTLAVSSLLPEDCGFGYRDSRFKREPSRFVVLSVRYRLDPSGRPLVRYPELARRLPEDPSPALVRETVLAIRREKSMVLDPVDPNRRSAGSFFTNPVVDAEKAGEVGLRAEGAGLLAMPRFETSDGRVKLSAAWLIEQAGITKSTRRGAVGISSRHCLALVHHGGGSTAELLALAAEVRARVEEKFGVTLEPEPTLVGCALGAAPASPA